MKGIPRLFLWGKKKKKKNPGRLSLKREDSEVASRLSKLDYRLEYFSIIEIPTILVRSTKDSGVLGRGRAFKNSVLKRCHFLF